LTKIYKNVKMLIVNICIIILLINIYGVDLNESMFLAVTICTFMISVYVWIAQPLKTMFSKTMQRAVSKWNKLTKTIIRQLKTVHFITKVTSPMQEINNSNRQGKQASIKWINVNQVLVNADKNKYKIIKAVKKQKNSIKLCT